MSPRVLANISPESNCSAVSVLVLFLHSFIVRTLFLRGWWNLSGQLASYSSICALPKSTASCTFTSSEHIHPETMFTRADAWPAVFKGSMQSFSFYQQFVCHFHPIWSVMPIPLVGGDVHWWGIFQISHVLHQSVTYVQAHCPSMDSFPIQCYSNETTWPVPIMHKWCLYEHVCPYPVPQSLSVALDMFSLQKSF